MRNENKSVINLNDIKYDTTRNIQIKYKPQRLSKTKESKNESTWIYARVQTSR